MKSLNTFVFSSLFALVAAFSIGCQPAEEPAVDTSTEAVVVEPDSNVTAEVETVETETP